MLGQSIPMTQKCSIVQNFPARYFKFGSDGLCESNGHGGSEGSQCDGGGGSHGCVMGVGAMG